MPDYKISQTFEPKPTEFVWLCWNCIPENTKRQIPTILLHICDECGEHQWDGMYVEKVEVEGT